MPSRSHGHTRHRRRRRHHHRRDQRLTNPNEGITLVHHAAGLDPEQQYRAFVPTITARFQSSRLITFYPTEWHQAHNIPYVRANLITIKDGAPRNGGALLV
ncbi:hypothetical protein GCM10025862_33240 [Arsenicicoccus piscis]|uniref:Uncharacterized protein n=1 Tax=Arsenicicoccus piscis TaxID=673954 RepID=A0ABQ6HTW7_9MICO|nr:hypothetical protein GCM10025862_33240 [Arsenicicoccus piscis]